MKLLVFFAGIIFVALVFLVLSDSDGESVSVETISLKDVATKALAEYSEEKQSSNKRIESELEGPPTAGIIKDLIQNKIDKNRKDFGSENPGDFYIAAIKDVKCSDKSKTKKEIIYLCFFEVTRGGKMAEQDPSGSKYRDGAYFKYQAGWWKIVER